MNKKILKETLVYKNWTNKNFASLVKWYYDTKKELDQLIEESNKYKAIMDGDNQASNENQLTLGEQLFIYNLIKNKARSVDDNSEILKLYKKLPIVFKELKDYQELHQIINSYRRTIEDILEYSINFYNLIPEPPKICRDMHFFIRLEKELKCINCGATTKDLHLTEEELDFLTKCAQKQNMLIKEATEEDIPFIQVMLDKYDEYISKLYQEAIENEDNEEYDSMGAWEEASVMNESRAHDLNQDLIKAHSLDSQKLDKKNLKYLSKEQAKILLEKETDLVKRYEIMISSGEHIPTLLKNAQSEDEIDALVTAYEKSLSNKYTNLTANTTINKKILQKKASY